MVLTPKPTVHLCHLAHPLDAVSNYGVYGLRAYMQFGFVAWVASPALIYLLCGFKPYGAPDTEMREIGLCRESVRS